MIRSSAIEPLLYCPLRFVGLIRKQGLTWANGNCYSRAHKAKASVPCAAPEPSSYLLLLGSREVKCSCSCLCKQRCCCRFLMLEGYTRRYFCWLSGTPDGPERAEEEAFLPADAQQREGACGLAGEEQPGLKRKFWGKKRCWRVYREHPASIQAFCQPSLGVRYLSNPPSMGTVRRKAAQGDETSADRRQPVKKKGSDMSVNCSNKDHGSTRNIYFCGPAYALVKLVLVSTACVVCVSVPQARGQLSC